MQTLQNYKERYFAHYPWQAEKFTVAEKKTVYLNY